jgi:hypothetical protein
MNALTLLLFTPTLKKSPFYDWELSTYGNLMGSNVGDPTKGITFASAITFAKSRSQAVHIRHPPAANSNLRSCDGCTEWSDGMAELAGAVRSHPLKTCQGTSDSISNTILPAVQGCPASSGFYAGAPQRLWP